MKGSITDMTRTVSAFFENSLYIDKVRAFLAKEPEIVSNPDAKPAACGIIEFKNVSFAYPSTPDESLDNVSLAITPGEKVAIVGYNGAGKTTLIKLLMRLYDPADGEIRCNGEDIREVDLVAYRSQFAVLFQDFQIYAATIAENVLASDGEPDAERLAWALDAAGLTARVTQMPQGADTQLTTEFTEGEELSGGERQKLAISRCLYQDSPIIVLDEPSSALDPVAEYEMNNTMLKLCKDKTMIMISHRLSTTKMADRIYMFERGRLIEQGSHAELMAQGGKYAEMFTVQAEKYRSVAGKQ